MERKRRSNENSEYLREKIRKLESKLVEKSRCRIRILSSSDSDSSEDIGRDVPISDPPTQPEAPPHDRPSSTQPSQQPAQLVSPQPGTSSTPDQPAPTADPTSSSPEDFELDEDILNLLGDAPKSDTPLGRGIHKDVASRWQEILNKGLQKDIKDKLVQDYLVPNNCTMLVPPILNPEAKAALPEALVKRDTSLMLRQKQIGLALSALAQATDILIKNKSTSPEILKPISDACRILCDSHFTETKLRRNFVISAINTNLKEALINTERDSYLFGENVSEKLKAAQTVQKSGDTLKNTQKPYNPFNKANFTIKNKHQKGHLNYRPLHRKSQNHNKSDAGRPRASQAANRYRERHRANQERSRSPPPRRTHRR